MNTYLSTETPRHIFSVGMIMVVCALPISRQLFSRVLCYSTAAAPGPALLAPIGGRPAGQQSLSSSKCTKMTPASDYACYDVGTHSPSTSQGYRICTSKKTSPPPSSKPCRPFGVRITPDLKFSKRVRHGISAFHCNTLLFLQRHRRYWLMRISVPMVLCLIDGWRNKPWGAGGVPDDISSGGRRRAREERSV
jgi:hypothetical protein